MRLIHLSDLHIGKRVNEVSMLEGQEYVLRQILQIIDTEKADAVLIAGDVYDKSIPPAEAVTLFDDFLCRLAKRDLPVFIITGAIGFWQSTSGTQRHTYFTCIQWEDRTCYAHG